ncbi:type III secretion system translocon subunit SctE [Acidovorax sp. CCYZU-2555]|uniref:type III secretion system translocon subunit SctE n=1 Tax=Acidovorax sp. CCYZU-2555 TaxID=2835042 RepID=UPI001BCEF056|nr:type III secretion system translocon subunit SctE [Acidovorax sp. CCYZU-2555]MBS7777595.1 type III secretion system translocon subunit SctE [Acidovorax sp. CCYZU-2555]
MNEVGTLPASFTPPATFQAPAPSGTDTPTAAANVRALDTAALLGDLGTSGKNGAAGSTGAALISNANGSPSIGNVAIDFSAEDLTAALLVLQGKTQDAQLRTAKEGLGVSRLKMEENHKKSMEKIETWIKKSESAAAKGKLGGIFSWVGKIAAFMATAIATVALAAATPLTGGAAAPLLALAIIGLVGSSMSLASSISQAAGGPPLELSSIMTKVCSTFLQAVGVPEEKLESASRVMAGAIGMLTGAMLVDSQLLGNMVSSIADLSISDKQAAAIVGTIFAMLATIALSVVTTVASGGSNSAKAVTEITKNISQMAKVAQHVAGATSALSSMAKAGISVGVAIDEHAAASAQVDRKLFAVLMVKLQAQMQEDQDQLKKLVQEIQEGVGQVSQMIAAAGESRSQIAANLGRSMA